MHARQSSQRVTAHVAIIPLSIRAWHFYRVGEAVSCPTLPTLFVDLCNIVYCLLYLAHLETLELYSNNTEAMEMQRLTKTIPGTKDYGLV